MARELQCVAAMQASAFNLYVRGYPEAGDNLVHNTFSGAFAVLDDDTVAALEKSASGDALDEDERALLDDEDLLDADVGIVVRSRDAEEAEYAAWFERRRTRTTLEAIVHVNRACNFACTYCCQEGVLDGSVMPEAIADDTAAWLVHRARTVGADSIFLMFCGGEPLLHPGRIEQVARRVAESGLTFSFGLITNGYFLTDELVDRLLPLGLVHAQVTLDGDATTHALTRVSKKGENTFGRIFDHVIAASRRIRVTVNGNYQDDTIHGFGPLLRALADAGLPEGSKVSFTPALAALDASDDAGSGACTWAGSNTQYHLALQNEVLRHGFTAGGSAHAVGPCEFHDRHSFAIDTDGTIHKCPGFIGHAEWGIGHVLTGLTDRYDAMLSAKPQESSCGSCSYRPTCSGGCIAAEWTRRGEMAGVNCEGEYFDRVSDDSVVREYLLATHEEARAAVARFPATVSLPTQPPRAQDNARGRRPDALRIIAA